MLSAYHGSFYLDLFVKNADVQITGVTKSFKSYYKCLKECSLLSVNELSLNAITKPPEVSVNTFFCLCLFLSLCFHAVKDIQLEPTTILFK